MSGCSDLLLQEKNEKNGVVSDVRRDCVFLWLLDSTSDFSDV